MSYLPIQVHSDSERQSSISAGKPQTEHSSSLQVIKIMFIFAFLAYLCHHTLYFKEISERWSEGKKKPKVKTNVVFREDFNLQDLLVDEEKMRDVTSKPCLSGKHNFSKMQVIYVKVDEVLHSLKRHQEILRILAFRALAVDFNDCDIADNVVGTSYHDI